VQVEAALQDVAKALEIPYQPFPRQQEFHRNPKKYRLFGGAAGPGKSVAILFEAVQQALEHDAGTGINTLLMRRTFPELEKSLLRYFREKVPRSLYSTFNESKHQVTWINGAITDFGFSQSEKDIYQYQGAEYLFIGVDELTQFTMGQWSFLTSRNRCPVLGTFPCMAGATNPGGIGHAWVKALWVDHKPAPGMDEPDKYDASEYAFISALLDDNPVYATDAAYRKTLDALPGQLRRAYLLGDWSIFAGQYFDIFDKRIHLLDAQEIKVEPWWPKWGSLDWGFAHPACFHLHTQDGPKTITYRELFGSGKGEHKLGEEIAQLCAGEKLSAMYLSPDAFAKRTDERTVAEQLDEVFEAYGLPSCSRADNDRIGGARLCHGMLLNSLAVVSTACPHLIEQIPLMIHDPDNLEDVLKVDAGEGNIGDDAYDSWRYGLKSHMNPAETPFPLVLRQRLQPIDDPTSRAIWAQKWTAQHNKQETAYSGSRARRAWSQGR